MGILERIQANRAQRHRVTRTGDRLDQELTALVRQAFDAGHTWQQIGDVLNVSKARVYQIRDGRR